MSAQASKFGNQESERKVPYTQYSETAPKHIISEMMINPSDTNGSRGTTEEDMPLANVPPFQSGHGSEVPNLKDNMPRRHSASPQRRTTRTSGSHENSSDQSPLHHHHQARVANKVGGFSPSWERKGSSEGSHGVAPNTPGRSRLRTSSQPDDSPEDGSAVPKFGEWDENNPSSADQFTGIFEKIKEEKQASAAKVPMITNDSVYLNSYHDGTGRNKSTKFCCFNWGRK